MYIYPFFFLYQKTNMDSEFMTVSGSSSDMDDLMDFLPFKFLDLDVSQFGRIIDNPFLKIKEKALDTHLPFEQRCQAVRYMQRIPRIDRYKHCMEVCIHLIQDSTVPLSHRYFFFANNEKNIKLDYELVNGCHEWFYDHADSLSSPLGYKILSAKYILCQIPVSNDKRAELHTFFSTLATTSSLEICYRADCAEILKDFAYTQEMRQLGRKVIEELGNLYLENKLHTIYTNAQNVHSETISEQTISVLRHMIGEYKTQLVTSLSSTSTTDDIYSFLLSESNVSVKESVIRSFHRIMVDPSRYEGHLLSDIMIMVWTKIGLSPHQPTLKQRFKEEMVDMDRGGCSSGYLTRLLNVLSGFYEDYNPVRISYRDQLRNEIFAYLNVARRSLSKSEQDRLVDEISSPEKPYITEFLRIYSPETDLRKEFIDTKIVTEEEFGSTWNTAMHDYFGL